MATYKKTRKGSKYDVSDFNLTDLMEQYSPLMKSMYNKFNRYFNNYEDKEDLRSQIQLEFIQLVQEYNKSHSVDFPFYIQKMLNFRVWHYIEKTQKISNNETASDYVNLELYSPNEVDQETVSLMDKIEAINSIDPDMTFGDKHRRVFTAILLEGKSVEDLAEEEGVDVKLISMRLYFLCEKLYKHAKMMDERKMAHREPIKLCREAIILCRLSIISSE